MAEQRESRVWGDQGTEPDPGDETYSGSERPIAEYDNWAMWSATTDIKTLFDWLDSVESELSDHTSSSSGVHGVDSTDTVAGQTDVDSTVESHRSAEVHDAPQPNQSHGNEDHDATFETESGAQQRVDDHENDTSGVHGVGASDVASTNDPVTQFDPGDLNDGEALINDNGSLSGSRDFGGGGPIPTHQTDITTDETIPDGEGAVMVGPITGTGSISGNGRLKVI